MKDSRITRIAACPLCGQAYAGRPTLSRKDNKTAICPDCGTREALAAIGVEAEEQDAILAILHRSLRGNQ